MTAEEFIKKWRESINYLGYPSVGIHVSWDLIPLDSKVEQLIGLEAWNKILESTPPWFKSPKKFKQLAQSKDSDYQQIVKEEKENGKIEYYRQNGLKEPFFCAFANADGSFILLGDGNHRFFDCIYLLNEEGVNLEKDQLRTSLDIIYLSSFEDIMKIRNIWKQSDQDETA